MSPQDPFFSEYAAAIQRMHELPDSDPRNWRNQAIIHADHCPHGMADFLEWHRFYVTYFEVICGEVIGNPNFALPFWNWSNHEGRLPDSFFGQNTLNVEFLSDPSNYTAPPTSRTAWGPINTSGTRGLTATSGLGSDPRFQETFGEAAIDRIKRLTDYDLFHRTLEGTPHNVGHVLTGNPNGHMINGLSSLDPVFWLHHCNVDRIWAEWQAAGNSTTANSIEYDGQFVDALGNLVKVSANDAHDHIAMGFTYETITTVPPLQIRGLRLPDQPATASFALAPQRLTTLGSLRNDEVSKVNVATNLRVKAPKLLDEMFSRRVFKATEPAGEPRDAVEPSRILAVLKGVSYPAVGKTGIVVNAFIDCPYLSPLTPSTDPHFAGSFAFFGQPMRGMNGGEFVLDVTDAVNHLAENGRLSSEGFNFQVMPVTVDSNGPKDAEFKINIIEIVRA